MFKNPIDRTRDRLLHVSYEWDFLLNRKNIAQKFKLQIAEML